MTAFHNTIPDFQLANPIYANASVSFYTVDGSGVSTGVLATLYANPIGATTVLNPQTLDADGKFPAPVYSNEAVIGVAVGPNVASHSTGVINGATLTTVGLTNVRLAKSSAYPVVNADNKFTIALGGSAYYTLTFNAPSGYDTDFAVRVLNEDTRAKKLSLNGTIYYLFPGQIATVIKQNGAWWTDCPLRWQSTLPITIYVRSDGSDSNDGFANTASGAFLTIQKAWDFAFAHFDLGGTGPLGNNNSLLIQAADGTYSSTTSVLDVGGVFVGQVSKTYVEVRGNLTTPSNCVLSGNTVAVAGGSNAVFSLNGFKLTSSAGYAMRADGGAWIDYSRIDFGTCALGHITTAKGGRTFDQGNITISGSAPFHSLASDFGENFETTGTTTLTGTPAFPSGYATCSQIGGFTSHTKTYVGAATGPRFAMVAGSFGGAATLTTLPGDVAGTTDDTSTFNLATIGTAYTSATPTPTPAGGAFGAGAVSAVFYKVKGKEGFASIKITIPLVGTAANWTNLTLPFSPKRDGSMIFSSGANTAAFIGTLTGGNQQLSISKASDGSLGVVDGTVLQGNWAGEI